mgnify:FL=1
MKLKNMSQEELQLLSYTDLTYKILKEEKKTLNTPTIFRKICDLLGYSDEEYAEKIGDYYTSLTIDKRFVMLENGEWDIRDNHVLNISLEDDDEEELESEEEEESEYDENIEETEEDIDEVIDDDELDDDVEEDIDDLAVLDEEEIGKEE